MHCTLLLFWDLCAITASRLLCLSPTSTVSGAGDFSQGLRTSAPTCAPCHSTIYLLLTCDSVKNCRHSSNAHPAYTMLSELVLSKAWVSVHMTMLPALCVESWAEQGLSPSEFKH